MKTALVPRSPVDLLLLACIAWLGSFACNYALQAIGLKPVYSYEALLAMAILCALGQGAALGTLQILRDRWMRRYLGWVLAYLVYGVLIFFESSQSTVAVQSLITLVEMSLLSLAFLGFIADPRRYRQAMAAFAVLAVFSAVMIVYDFIVPTFTTVPGRGAGLYMNSTTAGFVLSMLTIGAVDAVPKSLRVPFLLVCGVGVLLTFTRAAWLTWGLGVAWLGFHGRAATARRRLALTLLTTAFGGGVLFALFSGEFGGWLAQTSIARYLDTNTLARLGVGALSVSGDSADQRMEAARFALHDIAASPVFGHGIGHAYEWDFPVGPHNMYLMFCVEGGMIGLLLYLALLALLWRASVGIGRIMALQLIVYGFFSHNMLDEPPVLMMTTFVLAHGGMERKRATNTNRSVAAMSAAHA